MASLRRTIGTVLTAALILAVPAETAETAETDGHHAHAEDLHKEILISDAWARPTIGQAPNSAAYFTITNHGTQDDRLLAVSCPCAATAELHQTTMNDNVMHMEAIDGGLPLPAGQSVSFEPGAKHVMLMGVSDALIDGQTISLTLTFEHASEQTFAIPVQKTAPNATEDPHDPHAGMEHGAHNH